MLNSDVGLRKGGLEIERKKAISIFLLSLIVQLVYLYFRPLYQPKMDAALYDIIGFNIANGRGFSYDGIHPTTLYPLYPFFLSIIYFMFGHNYFLVQLFLAIFLAITCGVIYLIGKLVFNEKVGVAAAIFLSLYPPFFGLSRIMYAEPLFLMLLYTSIFLLLYFIKTEKLYIIITSGIILGAAILTKPLVIYFPLVISLFICRLFSFKKALKTVLLFNLAIFICMAPWIFRNYIVFKDFRPVSGFAIKNGNLAKVDWVAEYKREKAIELSKTYQAELLKKYYTQAKIKAHGESKTTFFKKIINYFGSDYAGDPQNIFDLVRKMYITSYGDILDIGIPFKAFSEDSNISKSYWRVILIKTIILLISFAIFLFGIIKMFLTIIKNKNKEKALLIFSFLSFTLFFYLWVIFFRQVGICGRYGIPMLPILVLFSFDWFIGIINNKL